MPSSSQRTSITWRNPKGRKVIWSSSLILRKLMTKCIGTSCVKLFRFLDSLMVSFLLLWMVFPRPLFLYYGTGVLPLILNQKRVLRGTCSPLPVCSLHRKAWCYDHVSNARASGPKVSHLFFADDVLLFTKAKPSVTNVLQDFCKISGLKISLEKSRVTNDRKDKILNITQIRFTSNLGKYLGFKIFQGRPKK